MSKFVPLLTTQQTQRQTQKNNGQTKKRYLSEGVVNGSISCASAEISLKSIFNIILSWIWVVRKQRKLERAKAVKDMNVKHERSNIPTHHKINSSTHQHTTHQHRLTYISTQKNQHNHQRNVIN
jgi:hypothetical protein